LRYKEVHIQEKRKRISSGGKHSAVKTKFHFQITILAGGSAEVDHGCRGPEKAPRQWKGGPDAGNLIARLASGTERKTARWYAFNARVLTG
jgi:hypothetical protein